MRARWAVVAVVLVLVGGALFMQRRARWEREEKAAHEADLRLDLLILRSAIANFHTANGRYPHSLQELVPKYIRAVPADPMTGTPSWRLTTEETVQPSDDFAQSSAPKGESVIIDVHSSAPGYGDY